MLCVTGWLIQVESEGVLEDRGQVGVLCCCVLFFVDKATAVPQPDEGLSVGQGPFRKGKKGPHQGD